MRDQEIIGLWEAYQQVHAQADVVSEDAQQVVGKALDAAAKNPVIKAIGKVIAPVGRGRETPTATSGGYRPVKEETNIFDVILEYLVTEGYAETNKAAIAIMANMSEEWRQNIVERGFGLGFLDLRKPAAKPKAEPAPKPPTVDSPGGAGGQVTVDKPYPATLGGLKGVKSTDAQGTEYFQPYTSSGRKEPSGKPFEPTTMPDSDRAQYKNTYTNTYKDIPASQSTKNPQSHLSRTGVPRVRFATRTYGID